MIEDIEAVVIPRINVTSLLSTLYRTVKVQTKGAGFSILQMSVEYNIDMEKY